LPVIRLKAPFFARSRDHQARCADAARLRTLIGLGLKRGAYRLCYLPVPALVAALVAALEQGLEQGLTASKKNSQLDPPLSCPANQ
tara:strand:- start:4401 stop:4658 length:258 start_codon:yes stop_codon:yes gene_type:complete